MMRGIQIETLASGGTGERRGAILRAASRRNAQLWFTRTLKAASNCDALALIAACDGDASGGDLRAGDFQNHLIQVGSE